MSLTNQQLIKAIQMYEQDKMSCEAIGKYFGTTHTVINYALKKAAIRIRSTGEFRRKANPDDIVDEYESGLSLCQIAKKHNMSPSTIRDILVKHNVKLRNRKQEAFKATAKIDKSEYQKIIQRYQNGEYPSKIAKDYDVHQDTIRQILKKHGIQLERTTKNRQLYLSGGFGSLTKEEFKRAKELYVSDELSCEEIGNILGKTMSQINYALKRGGIKIRQASDHIKIKLDMEAIRNDYENLKLTIFQIAPKYNVCPTTIYQRLKEIGVDIREHIRKIQKDEYYKIVAAYESGKLPGQIAEEFELCSRTVSDILKECGIKVDWHGSRHPNWKPETKLWKHIRQSDKHKQWSRACIERDNFVCQISGQRGGRLHAHHIKPFKAILMDFINLHPDLDPELDVEQLFTLAMNYEPFWSLDNGMTVSRKEHRKLHSQFHLRKISSHSNQLCRIF